MVQRNAFGSFLKGGSYSFKGSTSLDILRVPCYMVEYKNPGLWLVGVFIYSWEWPPGVAPQVKQ